MLDIRDHHKHTGEATRKIDQQVVYDYDGFPAWHNVGNRISNVMKTDNVVVLEEAKLNWSVDKTPMSAKMEDGTIIESSMFMVTRKLPDGKRVELTQVSEEWATLQNEEALNFFKDISHRAGFSTSGWVCGELDNGRTTFFLVPTGIKITLPGSGDLIEAHVLFTNPHDYGRSIDVRLVCIRAVSMVCLSMGLEDENSKLLKIHHRSLEDGVDAVPGQIRLSVEKQMREYENTAQLLCSTEYTEKEFREFLKKVFRTQSEKRARGGELSRLGQRALEFVEEQPGADWFRGSWWNAFNVVAFLADHEHGNSPETRLAASWYGYMRTAKLNALELAMTYARRHKAS